MGNLRRKQHILTPRQSERNLGAVEITQSQLGPRKSSRFQIGGFGKTLLCHSFLKICIHLVITQGACGGAVG